MSEQQRAERAERLLELRTRQLRRSNEMWCEAAEKALAGDTASLRLRLDLARAPYEEVVLS